MTSSTRLPPLDLSSTVRNSSQEAWDLTAQLIGNRQRGKVIKRDPRAHETLRALGGKAAYDAVASAPERIRARFIRVYAVLSEIAGLMGELEALTGAKEPAEWTDADSSA
ncbi:MAG TPA: hypothetical protein VFX20_15525 [Steroidobacteraceae bacterium]|nr:hypothetical protein [Steroidobacteraceae bacterium]